MSQGYFIALKKPDGSPDRPIGNDDGAISMFEDLGMAVRVAENLSTPDQPLHVFQVNLVFVGEVLA